jgi:hypothetical protein
VRGSNRTPDQLEVAEAGVAVPANDDMVAQHDRELGGGLLDVLGHRDRALLEDYAGDEPMLFLNGVERRRKGQRAT